MDLTPSNRRKHLGRRMRKLECEGRHRKRPSITKAMETLIKRGRRRENERNEGRERKRNGRRKEKEMEEGRERNGRRKEKSYILV